MKRVLGKVVEVALLAVLAVWSVQPQAGVATTKHNLSVTGPGTIKATSAVETQTCVFCHVPHNGSTAGPLWNRRTPANTYTPYTSTTNQATVGQPDGSSLLCLSCHDGTIALGELLSRGATNVTMAGGVTTMPAGVGNVGLNLSDDHPVSFVYNAALVTADGELANPATLTGKVKLQATKMQCSSCHDAHDDTNGKFLVMSNTASALCIVCHTKTNWAAGDHATKANTYTGANITFNGTAYGTPWTHTSGTTVAANACESCHRPHTAPGTRRLLNYLKEEDNCLVCHNGTAMNPALKNVAGEFTKASAHSTATMGLTGTHDPTEPANVTTKHVECVDCHNPHQSRSPVSTNPVGSNLPLAGPLIGTRGVTLANTAVASVTYEHEICFRCHGDTAAVTGATPRVARQLVQGNTRLEFQTTNPSFHPVAGARNNTGDVPSLIAPWTVASTMKCTHCHSNNTGPIVGVAGSGPNGPHGSIYTPILNKQYVTTDIGNATTTGGNPAYSAANYALCYSCHSETNILGDASFKEHSKHIVSAAAPCGTCHDAHGISGTQGNVTSNSHLINFNVGSPAGTGPVKPSGGITRFDDQGAFAGRCYLICHGKTHNPLSY